MFSVATLVWDRDKSRRLMFVPRRLMVARRLMVLGRCLMVSVFFFMLEQRQNQMSDGSDQTSDDSHMSDLIYHTTNFEEKSF